MTKERWEELSARSCDSFYDEACHGWQGEVVLAEKYPYATFLITFFGLFVVSILSIGLVLR